MGRKAYRVSLRQPGRRNTNMVYMARLSFFIRDGAHAGLWGNHNTAFYYQEDGRER